MTERLNWLRVIKFIKTESRLVVSRAWGKNREESVIRVSVLQNVKSSGCGWWWWSYNSINILSTVELFVVVQLLSHVWLFVTPWTAAQPLVLHYLSEFAQTLICWVCDAIQPSYPLWPPYPLPSIFPSIRVFSNGMALCIRWPKDWSFSFTISPSNEYSELIFFRIAWFDLLAVQGTLKSFL